MPMRKTIPLCWWCQHFDVDSYQNQYTYRCTAFPQRIPAEIVNVTYDHRAPHPDDGGTQFEQADLDDIMPRPMFRTSTREAVETQLIEAKFLLEMGRARGGIQPPPDDE